MVAPLKGMKVLKEYTGRWLSAGVIVLSMIGPLAAGQGSPRRKGPPFPSDPPALVAQLSSIAGTYRCWSFNVGGAGRRCASPPLVLHPDGTYEMSSERGTYSVVGDQIILSESKVRGPGRLQGGNQIVFEYEYRGLRHTVTYVRQDGAALPPPSSAEEVREVRRVPVDITLHFPPSDRSVGWINTASLIPEGENVGPEALARTDGKKTVAVYFRAVETGRVYTLFVSTGFGRRAIATVDLRNATGPVTLTVEVPEPTQDRDPPIPRPSEGGYRVPGGAPTPRETSPPEATEAPPCNPNVPRYAQPGCKE